MSTTTNDSHIPVLTSLQDLRSWRRSQRDQNIGFVPTMGALHDGHIDLVKASLSKNDTTVVSIFVNPAQFAPNEDLATYPKTFDADMARLRQLLPSSPERSSPEAEVALSKSSSSPSSEDGGIVVFLPSVKDIYPSGIVQDVSQQKGTFIEVKGFGHQLEGKTRPTFFRGVATVVTKLFNAVEPTRAYFGQKDIQQALILRRLVSDLLLSHPLPQNLIVVPTHRDLTSGLALSSRNVYLSDSERQYAHLLYRCLSKVKALWESGNHSASSALSAAVSELESSIREAARESGDTAVLKVDYVSLVDPETLEEADWNYSAEPDRPAVIVGAMWAGKTRLIDNVLSGNTSGILGGGDTT